MSSCIDLCNADVWDDAKMKKQLPKPVYERLKADTISGKETSKDDCKVIAKALFEWSKTRGAVNFAHWFFPVRSGSGSLGTVAGMKHDTFVDLDWEKGAPFGKDFSAAFPYSRLFAGETDGSSFPNGGLRVTHAAAAFTSWARSCNPCVVDGTLRIPAAFVTRNGDALDDLTPLLKANDALDSAGKALLEKMGHKCNQVVSYLGWEQEFFIISKESFLKRPDLVNCGRVLIGAPCSRNQQMDQHYFGSIPVRVKAFLDDLQTACFKTGISLNVHHNEVAPGQHEVSPIFSISDYSSIGNQLMMELGKDLAMKHGLVILYHEKPFAGINGTGKHANWSVGTDTGLNFFDPDGCGDMGSKLFVTAIALLAHALNQHNTIYRACVASAGNDHRLGAQEAPPAIISLYPGPTIEKFLEEVINGAELDGLDVSAVVLDTGVNALNSIKTAVDDRNRTAPFPWCGNRFEFRAVGGAMNTAFPMCVCNTTYADAMNTLSAKLETGTSLRDAVADMLKENKRVIFTGNGYSAEWPVEAEKRGLPNLKTTIDAAEAFKAPAVKELFGYLKVMSDKEVDARAELMFENYALTLEIEANTLIDMLEQGVIPAMATDMATYAGESAFLAGDRKAVYTSVKEGSDKLKKVMAGVPEDVEECAKFFCDTIRPLMLEIRGNVDAAEKLVPRDIWPYPSYEEMLHSHHM